MKLTLEKQDFLNAVSLVREVAATPSKDIMPVLSNILIRTGDRKIQIAATDLTTSIKARMRGGIQEHGVITIAAKKLGEIARELPNKPITITTSDNHRAMIKCGKGSYTIIGHSDEDFPKLPDPAPGGIVVDSSILRGMINKTEFAAAADEERYWLNAIHMELIEDKLELAATSGSKVSIVNTEIEEPEVDEPIKAILPLKACAEVKSAFEESEFVEISTSENQIVFSDEETILTTRTIEADYPNYRSVIPRDNDKKIVVDREELAAVLKRVALFSNVKTGSVVFHLEPDELRVTAMDRNIGDAEESMSVLECDGELPFEIRLSSPFLIEALNRIDGGRLVMTFKGPKDLVDVYGDKHRNHRCIMAAMYEVESDKSEENE